MTRINAETYEPLSHKTGPDTELEAARSMFEPAKNLREKVLALIKRYGPMTDEEILGRFRDHFWADADHMVVERRRNDLKNLNLVEDSGERRPSSKGRKCVVWRVKEDTDSISRPETDAAPPA